MKNLIIILLMIIVFFSGINVGGYFYRPPTVDYILGYTESVSRDGFVEVEPAINFTTVHLVSDCKDVFFDITVDQAYSIHKGLEGSLGVRPLTHDIAGDIMENFDIEITHVRIDRFENDIYYATIFLQRENQILELDARPSDSIALALRTDTPVYFKKSILEEMGTDVC